VKKILLVVLFLAVDISGCNAAPDVPSLASPIPSPPLAHDYTWGEVQLPKGSYLFVEALVHDEASGTCQYPPSAQQPPLGYKFSEEILVIDWTSLDVGLIGSINKEQIIERATGFVGFFGQMSTESYSLGGATRASLSVMRSLPMSGDFPYEATGSPIIVEAADEHGAVVVSVKGQAFLLEPGAVWQESQKYEPQVGCLVTRTITLVNHELVSESELQFTDEPIV